MDGTVWRICLGIPCTCFVFGLRDLYRTQAHVLFSLQQLLHVRKGLRLGPRKVVGLRPSCGSGVILLPAGGPVIAVHIERVGRTSVFGAGTVTERSNGKGPKGTQNRIHTHTDTIKGLNRRPRTRKPKLAAGELTGGCSA